MKKQLVLVLTLSSLLMSACEGDDPKPITTNRIPAKPIPVLPVSINSFYPMSAPCGSTVAIFGENFGTTISDNYVTFDTRQAEITEVQTGFMMVIVPTNLLQGDYVINLSANGQSASSTQAFTVTNDIN